MVGADLLERARRHLIRYCRTWQPPFIVSGRGSTVIDIDGREYLDFTSGQMCATIGHNHPRVVKALELSAQRILHLNSTLLAPETVELAERLASLLPPSLSMSIFLNTGERSQRGRPEAGQDHHRPLRDGRPDQELPRPDGRSGFLDLRHRPARARPGASRFRSSGSLLLSVSRPERLPRL